METTPEMQSTLVDWDKLLRNRKDKPLILGRPAAVSAPDGWIRISRSRVGTLMWGAIGILLFGLPFLALGIAGLFLAKSNLLAIAGAILMGGMGGSMTCLGILTMLKKDSFCANSVTGVAEIRWGYWPRVQVLKVPLPNLAMCLYVNSHDKSVSRIGQLALDVWQVGRSDSAIILCMCKRRRPIRAAFDALRQLGVEGADETIAEVRTLTGAQIQVPRTRVDAYGMRAASMSLQFPAEEVAELSRTRAALFQSAFITAGGCTLMACCVFAALDRQSKTPGIVICGLALVLGGAMFLFGLLGLIGFFQGLKPVRFDKLRGLVIVGGLTVLSRQRLFSLDDVAALQICSYAGIGSDKKPFKIMELNVVLAEPPGERINLMSHGSEVRLRQDGAVLADFLCVPLLDHA